MPYVYRHIRLDTNQPFYIGIGTGRNYNRAFTIKSRNELWLNIIGKTEYLVEILFDEITWEEACKKEIEFIKIYGRRNNNTGYLANMTDGGEGVLGMVASIFTRNKLRMCRVGRKHTESSILKMKSRKPTEETKLKIAAASTGRKHSEETLSKLRGRKVSEEVKAIIGLKNSQRIRTEKEKENIRLSRLGNKNSVGRVLTKEHQEKMRLGRVQAALKQKK